MASAFAADARGGGAWWRVSCSALDCPQWRGVGVGAQEGHLILWCTRSRVCAGPDRVLFLPGGLLDRADLPDYLDGTLPGE